jgi:hypothetical protein
VRRSAPTMTGSGGVTSYLVFQVLGTGMDICGVESV